VTLRARLYDANGEERDVDLTADLIRQIDDRRLLWIDVDERSDESLGLLAAALELQPRLTEQLRTVGQRARLLRFPDRVVITLGALERDADEVGRRELDVLVGRNLVVTVHDGPLSAIAEFANQLEDEVGLGELEAGAFMTGLVDAVLTTYFKEIDAIERDIEALDQVALQRRAGTAFLSAVVVLRHRIAVVRRALTPNRDALAPIVRPDFEVHKDLIRAWPGTIERLERAIDGVDKARELLVGSFDIYLGRASQRSNDVMKILTLVSAIALPAIVLAGVMGMNFKLPFFEDANNFWVVVAAMVGLAVGILAVSRWRGWI
jgi:magnesium/cobalt transport protein CorA